MATAVNRAFGGGRCSRDFDMLTLCAPGQQMITTFLDSNSYITLRLDRIIRFFLETFFDFLMQFSLNVQNIFLNFTEKIRFWNTNYWKIQKRSSVIHQTKFCTKWFWILVAFQKTLVYEGLWKIAKAPKCGFIFLGWATPELFPFPDAILRYTVFLHVCGL